MKKTIKVTKVILALATSLACTIPSLADTDVTAYGLVTYNAIKDDTSDDLYFGRHEFAETRFGLKGLTNYGNVKLGAQLEVGLDEGVSNMLHSESNSRTRIQEFWVEGKWGKVKMGTGQGITWVVSDLDQSGTWLSDPLGMSQRFGATRRGPAGKSQTPFVQVQSIFNERIVYESPSFLEGAKVYAQLGEAGSYEMAVKYVANGWRVNVWSVDYGDIDRDEDSQANIDGNGTNGFFGAKDGRGVLAGYKHSTGVNFTSTYGISNQINGGDREFANWKLGYTKGKHAVSVSMGNYSSEDGTGIKGSDHTRTTLAYNIKPVAGVQFWAQATQGDTDNQEAFTAIALGGLVKF